MDEYIEQLLAEMQTPAVLQDVVRNILDAPIPEAVKKRLLKPLLPEAYRPTPPPRKAHERKRKAIIKEFDPVVKQPKTRLGRIDDGFDLDISTSIRELEGEAGRLLRLAKTQHRREGAAHVFSSWRRESPDDLDDLVVNVRLAAGVLIQDYTLTSPRAMELLQKIRGEFILKIKFIRKPTPNIDIWVVEDAFTPLKQVRDGRTLTISTATAPGALVGIDGLYYKNAYPVSAVIYGLYPIREPDQNNLAPMREGYFNCVAQRVIEHFENAKKGLGVTEARDNKIKAWEVNKI